MTFGEHIRQWREEHRVGLRRFAKAVGVSPTFVSKMERGIGPLPGEETIRKIVITFFLRFLALCFLRYSSFSNCQKFRLLFQEANKTCSRREGLPRILCLCSSHEVSHTICRLTMCG